MRLNAKVSINFSRIIPPNNLTRFEESENFWRILPEKTEWENENWLWLMCIIQEIRNRIRVTGRFLTASNAVSLFRRTFSSKPKAFFVAYIKLLTNLFISLLNLKHIHIFNKVS